MFKRFTVLILVVTFLISTTACANTKVIDEVKYDYYGLLNEDDKKNPNIEYEVV